MAVVKKGKAHAKAEDPNKKSAKGVQIQRENIMKRFKESQEELMKKYKGLKEDATDDKVSECAELFEKKYKEIRKDIEQVGEVKLNKKEKKGAKEDTLDADVKAFFEKNLVKIYLKVLKTVMSTVKHGKEHEKSNAMVQAMLTFKKLAAMDQSGEEKTAETLRKYILEIGFVDLAKNLKMVKEKEKVDVKQQRSFARFQLAHMGMHLDHDAPAERDRRVDKFNPDLWQRQLFDVVDHRESALIIAPTSSGKTYASYYAMENVLRESDEGTIVYVAPTKALVNQVAATVCARFSKRKMDLPPGRVVQGIYTRDFKENTLNCQILVTVPEGLEILLLSPERSAWAKSLRYVIFDEVHNIGAESRGETWEHIITLIRCPFLALSATVANPDTLHSWLQRAEKYKMERDIQDGCKEQRSYDVKLVPSVGKRIERHADLKKHVYRTAAEGSGSGAELQPLHPIAALKPSVLRKTRSIPGHVTMAPSECLELYDALEGALGKEAVAGVEPSKVLGENFLKKAAVSDYNQMLKTFFLEQFMKDEAILEKLRAALKTGGKHSESSTEEDSQLTREAKYIQSEFPSLIAHLKEKNKLPCIVFTFNREYCNGLTKIICEDFEQKLDDTKMSDKYAEKQKAKEKLDAAEEKKQKKLQAKMDKIESKQGGDDNKRRQQNDRDENEALKELNSVFKEFPDFTLVARNTLGDDDAEYIYNNLLTSDPLFQGAMKYGISWHHAGNNAKMRNATEMLFREKFLNVVIATTTLAQGIHMPCRSVVFAGDSVFLNSLNYHQCAGRAGRRGFDADGNVIFFGIKRSKISRLLTSNLPKIIGNNPTCLSLILRVFMMTSGHLKDEVRQDAISRALCLLENPLITSFQSNIGPRLKFYFMYCTDYLARQGLIDSKGDPVGFARLASHLHYHEPYNIAFCHLMQRGVLHTVCKKTELGVISEDTMRDLLILLNFLFGRMKLHIPSYQVFTARF